jgi:DNA-binding GntR family transcriptional regulator
MTVTAGESTVKDPDSSSGGPLVATPLRVRVRDHIAARIVDGTYVPGQRLTELEIARSLGTSQTPAREALRDLAGMGFVESEPNKGCRVRELDSEDLRQAHPVRAALEEIAGHSAARHLKGKTTDLASALDGMRAAQENGDLIGLCFHSTRFHRHIVESAGNDALTRAWNALGIEMLTLVGAAHDQVGFPNSVEEHAAIMAALEAGQAAAAARLLKSHACSYVTRDPGSTGALCTTP